MAEELLENNPEEKAGEKKSAAKKSEKAPKKKGPGLWVRIKNFFRDYKSELKKITWLSFPEVVRNTVVVCVVMIISGAIVGVFDFAFTKLVLWLGALI